jgi:hypothetical protein
VNRRTLATWASVGIGIAALAALALAVGPLRPTPSGLTLGVDGGVDCGWYCGASVSGTLVVHCQGQLNAYAVDRSGIGGHVSVAQEARKPVASSHDSATAPRSVEFVLLPAGFYYVADNHEPPRCAALAWVMAGLTTTAENHAGFAGLSKGRPGSSQAPAIPTPSPVTRTAP